MDERYLTVGEVAKRFGVSRPTIWRWAKAGGFPSPFEVSSGTTRWRLSDLRAFEATLASKAAREA